MELFKTTALGLNKKVDNSLSTFKSTITKLKQTIAKAKVAKAERQKKIRELEVECSNLDKVSERADAFARNLENLFK